MHTPHTGAVALPRPTSFPRPHVRAFAPHPAIHPRPARTRRLANGLSFAGMAALIVAMLAMIFFIYHDQRNAAILPAVQQSPAVASPTAQPGGGSWLQWGGDAAHTQNAPGPGPFGAPALLWTYKPNDPVTFGNFTDTGNLVDGVLYLAGFRDLVAIDVSTGKELWRSEGVGGFSAIDGDGIIMRSTEQTSAGYDLVRVNRKDGSIAWTAAQGSLDDKSAPLIADGVGYVPSSNDLLAFDPATGKELWRTPLDVHASRGAAAANGLLVIGDEQGKIYGISTNGGDVVWTYQVDATTVGHPAIANGLVYFAAFGGQTPVLDALDAATGALKWSVAFPGPTSGHFYSPAINDTTLYATGTDGALYAYDAITGAPRWSYQSDANDSNSGTLVGDTVYLGGPDGVLYAVDAGTGVERWRFSLNGEYVGSVPVVVDGVIYVATSTSLYAIGGSGENTTVATPAAVSTSAAVAPTVAAGTNEPVSFVWTARGSGAKQLSFPATLALDPHGQIWVVTPPGTFYIFDLDGNLLETWGSQGRGDGQFNFNDPVGGDLGWIFFTPDGGFYVADSANYRIQQFDKDRNFVRAWGTKGTGDGQFLAPIGMALDDQGNLLVTDLFRNDVQRFTPDGTFIDKFGGTGSGPGQFQQAAFITLGPDGNFWIGDIVNNRIQVFKQDGTFLFEFGGAGTGRGTFNGPDQVVFDDNGHAFVADQFNNQVQVFDMQGHFLYQFGETGEGDGQFDVVGSIAINHGTSLIIDDYHNHRIQKFRITGPFPAPASEATPVS